VNRSFDGWCGVVDDLVIHVRAERAPSRVPSSRRSFPRL
jgi:hypothetical protein